MQSLTYDADTKKATFTIPDILPDCMQYMVNGVRYNEAGTYTIDVPDMQNIYIQLLPKDRNNDVEETARIIIYVKGSNEFIDGKRQLVKINHVVFQRLGDTWDEYDNWVVGKSYKEYADEFGTELDDTEYQKVFGK